MIMNMTAILNLIDVFIRCPTHLIDLTATIYYSNMYKNTYKT